MTPSSSPNSLSNIPANVPPISSQLNVIGLSLVLLLKSYISLLTFKVSYRQVIEQIVIIGFNTLPMVILMTTFSGMVIAVETADWLEKYGAREAVGALICLSSVIEIAPVFVSFAIGAQAGTAITAELAHLQITEQVSAMRLAKVNPINFLVTPRLVAMIYSLPHAIIIGAFCSIIGGMVVSSLQANIEYNVYLDSAWRALKLKDIWYSVIKSFILANYLIAIHTSFGLGTRGGAKELGIMTSLSTIWVAVGVVLIDTLLDYFMYIG